MRFAATALLWVVATAALAVAVPTAWAQLNIVDSDGYAAMARQAATDPVLQGAAASELASQATALINQRGHSVDPAVVRSTAAAYTAGPSFPTQFALVNRVVHAWIFGNEQTASDPWVVDVAPMLNDSSLQQMLSSFHVRVPATLTVPVTLSAPEPVRSGRLRPFATWNLWVCLGTMALGGFCAILTLVAARSRGKALTGLGVSAMLVGACGWAAIEVARRHIDVALDDTTGDIRAIADAMVGHAEAGLHHWLDLTLAGGGVLVVFGVLVAALGGLRRDH